MWTVETLFRILVDLFRITSCETDAYASVCISCMFAFHRDALFHGNILFIIWGQYAAKLQDHQIRASKVSTSSLGESPEKTFTLRRTFLMHSSHCLKLFVASSVSEPISEKQKAVLNLFRMCTNSSSPCCALME